MDEIDKLLANLDPTHRPEIPPEGRQESLRDRPGNPSISPPDVGTTPADSIDALLQTLDEPQKSPSSSRSVGAALPIPPTPPSPHPPIPPSQNPKIPHPPIASSPASKPNTKNAIGKRNNNAKRNCARNKNSNNALNKNDNNA